MASYNNFNSTARDNVILYQLSNEVGADLAVMATDTGFSIQLVSKSGKPIGEAKEIVFPVTPTPELPTITNFYIDYNPETEDWRKLILVFSDGTKSECDLRPIYNDYISKQDKLTPGEGISIENNVISVIPAVITTLCYEELQDLPENTVVIAGYGSNDITTVNYNTEDSSLRFD